MTTTAKIEKQNFSGGEAGRLLRAHSDLARYQSSVEVLENFVVLAEGVLTRRPGTKLTGELADSSELGRLMPMRVSGSDSFMLVFNADLLRFIKGGGFLGASLDTPYPEASLELLRGRSVGNVMYLAAGANGIAPRQLNRVSDSDWNFSAYAPADGPFENQNLDRAKVIRAAAPSGQMLLTGSGDPFQSGQEGALFRLDESNLALTPEWRANEAIAPVIEPVPAGIAFGDFFNPANAFDGNAASDATKVAAATGLLGETGTSTVRSVTVKGSASIGFALANAFVQVYLFGKQGAGPANAFDGTQLATQIIGDAAGQTVTLFSSDPVTVWNHRWVVITTAPADNLAISEITFDRFQAAAPVRRRWDGNVYDALNNGNTGATPPTHTEGDAIHGEITWRYRHGPYGIVRIDQLFSVNSALATVLVTLPDSVVAQPGYRWYPPSWWSGTNGPGFPDNVQLAGNRLVWMRGNRFWETVPDTPLSFALTDDELSALAERLSQNDGTLPDIMWAMSSGITVFGARDGEFIVRGPSTFDPLTPANIRVVDDSGEGSCPHVPARLDGGVVFIGRSRDRLHFAKFDRLSETLNPVEISKGARHVVERGAWRVSWERDPNRILWVRTGEIGAGAEALAACTIMPEENILAWHRHPLGRTGAGLPADTANAAVEDIATIPTSDEGRSDTYLIVRRIINGVTRRFVEQVQPFFRPLDPGNPTAEGAWLVDCGIRVISSQMTSVTVAHLKGATVRVFADGADRGLTTCHATTGAVAIDPPADNVLVGLPIVGRVRDLPRNVVTREGTTKGSRKRTNHFQADMVFSAGGKMRAYDPVRADGGLFTDLQRTGTLPFTAPVPLRTGRVIDSISAAWGEEGQLELVCDNALPFTLTGLMPMVQIGDA